MVFYGFVVYYGFVSVCFLKGKGMVWFGLVYLFFEGGGFGLVWFKFFCFGGLVGFFFYFEGSLVELCFVVSYFYVLSGSVGWVMLSVGWVMLMVY